MPDYSGAIAYALNRLHSELSSDLCYHNAWHTEHDVMPAAVRLAELSGLPQADIRLLEVAAAYHDIGFTITNIEHERVGAELAAQVLPGYGFDPEQIAQIVGMIMATRLPQSPHTPLEAILADADLDLLGREDFPARNRALRRELAIFGRVMSDEEWKISQLRFFEQHTYFTPAAAALRSAGKQANLAAFRAQST